MNPGEPQGDLLQPRPTADAAAALEQLRSDYQQLQSLFIVALGALLVLGLSTCLFMAKQWRMVRAQVEEQRPNVQRMWAEYQRTTEPLVQKFTARLQGFAAQNRDFQPIVDRYREPLRAYFGPAVPAPSAKSPPSSQPAAR